MPETVRQVKREANRGEENIIMQIAKESKFARIAFKNGINVLVHNVEPIFDERFYEVIISPKVLRGNNHYGYAYVEARGSKNSSLVFTYTPPMLGKPAQYNSFWLYKNECIKLVEEETLAMCRRIFQPLLAV